MKSFFRSLALLVAFLTGAWLPAAERIPPAPARYFNDYAGVVSRPAADALNLQLEQYERESSNQLLVVVFPRMESDSSVEDYTVRVAQAWKAGQQGRNNGAVLFVFKDDHKLYLQVGYGLEATLTDAIASQIIERELKPAFRAGNFETGLRAAVTAMIAATKGEYTGTGRTRAEHPRSSPSGPGAVIVGLLILLFFLFVIIRFIQFIRHGLGLQPTILGNPRRRTIVAATTPWWGGGGSGGNWGGGSGGGGGGFSGGGGSFGGGGAGGSW